MKTITREQYLAATGLFYLAQKKAREVVRLDEELNALLGEEQGMSHISDAIYDKDDTLDKALERAGIVSDAP